MKGILHLIIAMSAMAGFLIGNNVVDIDHLSYGAKQMWKQFWTDDNTPPRDTNITFLHKPVVILSMASFFLFLGLGLFIHFFTDNVRFS